MASASNVSEVYVPKVPLSKRIKADFKRNKYKYLLVLPVLAFFIIFAYKPMYGLIIAFKDYRPAKGIMGSNWVGMKHFVNFFTDPYFGRLLRNTLSISLLTIVFGFPAPIILALLLNEVRGVRFKKTVQTVTYMPYFISLVVVCALIRTYTLSDGLVSQIMVFFGGTAQNVLMNSKYFYPIYVISDVWQNIGWNSIIYLAALSAIDQEQYEAARIDGAGRFKQMLHITLPSLLPTIMVLFILRMGGVLNVGQEKILLLYTQSTYEVADVFSTYIYRKSFEAINPAYSFSTAAGMFNSVVNIIFLSLTNFISKKATDSGLF